MITRVLLKNWKSHRDTELTFSGGVNVLVGEMGSGKSSVVEALTFALYGTTPRLQSRVVTLDELVRRVPTQQEEAVVEADFVRDGTTYTVRREITVSGDSATTSTSEFREEGELVTAPQSSEVTEEVERVLGMDYDLFARAIYAEQNNLDAFLNEAPGQRKEQIDELLRIDRFEDARSTLVTATNRLKERRREAETSLDTLREELEEADAEGLAEKQEELETRLGELREEQEELEDELEALTERFETLQERKARAEALEKKQNTLEGVIETKTERAKRLAEEAEDVAGLGQDALQERKEELNEELETVEDVEEELNETETTLEHRQERKEELDATIAELEEKAEQLDELEAVENNLAEAEDRLAEARAEVERGRARIDDITDTIQDLSQAAEECPTCGQELTDEHRVAVLQDRKKERERLEDRVDEAQETVDALEGKVADLQEEREDLLGLQDVPAQLEAAQEQQEELEETIETLEERKAELEEAYAPERVEELEAELERVATAEDRLAVLEEIDAKQEELAEVEETQEELAFDAEELEELREDVNKRETRLEVVRSTITNKEELHEERAQRLEELQRKEERREELAERVSGYRDRVDFADRLLAALEETQVELRQRFVADVNQVMHRVWEQVYPYQDYTGIRLNAEEGYAVEVEDSEGSWVNVEGEVSGGERHTAALTLRIALSIVLTPEWRILVLDEPTHNLDATAISDLAETLRTTVSDIVEQLFLITHEEDLEAAVTGDLYLFAKNETADGLTQVAAGSENE